VDSFPEPNLIHKCSVGNVISNVLMTLPVKRTFPFQPDVIGNAGDLNWNERKERA